MKINSLTALIHVACSKVVASHSSLRTAFISQSPIANQIIAVSSGTLFRSKSFYVPPEKKRIEMAADDSSNEINSLASHSLPSPLILGSSSFTRKLILREMNIPFHIIVRSIDEKSIGDRSKDPHDLVLAVARAKMDRLVDAFSRGECDTDLPATDADGEFVILTGDQVITCDNTILEKPSDIAEAKQFVRMYASHPPSTVGSVILTHYPSGTTVEGTDKATIYFKDSVGKIDTKTNLDLVDRMLTEEAPILSCAGGLMIEHPLVREHVERIDGTEDSVMGLSKALVQKLLRELRIKLDSRDAT